MKWIGQHIWEQISRFRNNVHIEGEGYKLEINNTTTSSATQGGKINLKSDDGAALGDDHQLGKIGFWAAEDGGGTLREGASIRAFADAAWSASENGTRLEFYTMDGNLSSELSLTLDSDLLATFVGGVTVGGTLTVDSVGVSAIQTSSESFVDNDTSLMTSAAIDDRINTAVTAEDLDVTSDSGTIDIDLNSETLTIAGGGGIDTSATGTTVTITGEDATDSNKGIASFNSDHFSVSSGAVSLAETITVTSSTADKPALTLKDTTNDAQAARFVMEKDGGAGTNNDNVAELEFFSKDGSNNSQMYGKILVEIDEATHGQESGKMSLRVASHDGEQQEGLIITGGSVEDEVDVVLGTGTASVTTVAGDLTVTGSDLTFDSVALTAIQTSGESFADNDTSVMTSAAIDDAILKGGSATTIKVLPVDFMMNEDGGVNKSIQYDDTGTIGVRASDANGELYAFVEIPIRKTATAVTVYGSDTSNVVNVYEADINASGLADKTPGGGCVVGDSCDITDVAADATNYLVIKVTVTATADIVYGAAVTITDS